MIHAAVAQQGHRYRMGSKSVIAMQSGVVVVVRELDATEPYALGASKTVKASWLAAEPMVYFGGEIPGSFDRQKAPLNATSTSD